MNIIIIGATSGIGKCLLTKYAIEGNRIGIVGRRQTLLEELQKQYPANVITCAADIAQQHEIAQAISIFQSQLHHIDLAIVCSGVGELNPMLDFSIELPTISTNVVGWTYVIDTLYHIFQQQGFGHLVAITSIGGLRGEPEAPAYSASKAYQINYMEALRKKAHKAGNLIRITDIRPGLVNTRMAKGDRLFWVMPVEKVTDQMIDVIRHKQSKAYVTKRWHFLAAITLHLPFFLYKRM
ncbi:MAG: SDR family NAD(P)-dependent oxidoreductase [Bacteroidales bacterium]|nr:SDR family NAD(P)-dependent oxidoreductase [Bacteroidales bacterium]